MVVQVREQLSVDRELLVQPDALIPWQLVGHRGGAIAVNLAHSPRIVAIGGDGGVYELFRTRSTVEQP